MFALGNVKIKNCYLHLKIMTSVKDNVQFLIAVQVLKDNDEGLYQVKICRVF